MAQSITARSASLIPAFTYLLNQYIRHHKIDQANGFSLAAPIEYTSVATYYSDFDVGNYDICIGSWDTFAVRYLGGVPCKYICTITTAQMINFLTIEGSGINGIADLAGKVIAAPQSTGTYRMARAVVKEFDGIDLEGDATVQNVVNPAASISVLRAGSADVGLSWEPSVSNGMSEDARLRILYNVGDRYTEATGHTLPYFGVAVRNELLERDPEIGARISKTFADCIAGILGDVDGAVKIVGEQTGFPPAVLREAISSGRLSFAYSSMAEEAERQVVLGAAEFCARNELLPSVPDEGFFYTG
jgi:NitT/TauT family transport system substrate-binding protein